MSSRRCVVIQQSGGTQAIGLGHEQPLMLSKHCNRRRCGLGSRRELIATSRLPIFVFFMRRHSTGESKFYSLNRLSYCFLVSLVIDGEMLGEGYTLLPHCIICFQVWTRSSLLIVPFFSTSLSPRNRVQLEARPLLLPDSDRTCIMLPSPLFILI
jgi:hypothetical protein